jgi:hypothetical protein
MPGKQEYGGVGHFVLQATALCQRKDDRQQQELRGNDEEI